MSKEKSYNANTWTSARFISFVKSALRGARWPAKYECIKNAKRGYGLYECALCKTVGPPSLAPEPGKKTRIKNIVADHIEPVVDPNIGFVDWNTFIERLYVEADGFQALCAACHKIKTDEENAIARERRTVEKRL